MSPSANDLTKGKKILVVLTNTSTLRSQESSEHRTGFDVKAVAYIWDAFHKKKRLSVEFTTPRGGAAPMDPKSMELSEDDPIVQEFLNDRTVLDQFKDTDKIDELRPENYCAVFLPGTHGALIDFPNCQTLATFVTKVYQNNGLIATIGHGIAGLLSAKYRTGSGREEEGTDQPFLKGKKVTCFTKEEEKKIGYEKSLPFMIEEKVKELGAKLENKHPFESNVVTDQRLITAQNMQSTKEWIATIMKEGKMMD